MNKTIIVAGYGPGISKAVAEKFGAEGFQVALVARNAERIAAGVKELEGKGVKARSFAADLADPAKARAVVNQVRDSLGRVTALMWNVYGSTAGDLLTADTAALRAVIDVGTASLIAATQEARVDLKDTRGSLLVTNGGLGVSDPKVDAMAVQWGMMGAAIANAAKHKVVGLLSEQLKKDGVYVGQVMVLGTVKGTAFDRGQGGIDPALIAAKFWDLHQRRAETFAQIG